MFIPFVYLLKRVGIPVSFQYVMEFFRAIDKGLVTDLDRLFLVMRLIFVKRVEHYDLFERAFSAYFLGQTERLQIPEVETIMAGKPFQEWLQQQIEAGVIAPEKIHDMPLEELMRKFWETMMEQQEAHHGGSKWIGTRGNSPWGHSGFSKGGVRMGGMSKNRSAQKVFGGRRYIDYSGEASLSADNIRQALSAMKRMVPVGPSSELNVDDTIYLTGKNGGEIELVFDRELRNRIKVMVFFDNGGYSMSPFVGLVRLLFQKMRDQFKDLDYFYFHNTIYDGVFSDPHRTKLVTVEKLLERDKNTRLFVVGDANMGPYELLSPYGSINMYGHSPVPSIVTLRNIAEAFPYSVWLNPIRKQYWKYESRTISDIGGVFHMEDMTLNGLKSAVEYLREKD